MQELVTYADFISLEVLEYLFNSSTENPFNRKSKTANPVTKIYLNYCHCPIQIYSTIHSRNNRDNSGRQFILELGDVDMLFILSSHSATISSDPGRNFLTDKGPLRPF